MQTSRRRPPTDPHITAAAAGLRRGAAALDAMGSSLKQVRVNDSIQLEQLDAETQET